MDFWYWCQHLKLSYTIPHYCVSAHGLLVQMSASQAILIRVTFLCKCSWTFGMMPASQAILNRATLLCKCSWTFGVDASISSYPDPCHTSLSVLMDFWYRCQHLKLSWTFTSIQRIHHWCFALHDGCIIASPAFWHWSKHLGLARTVYTHRIWAYVWWFPC